MSLFVQSKAQTDRPCGAPLLPLSGCATSTPIVMAGSAFQAGDAPIPPGCNLAYSNDVWARIVAPAADFNLTFITRTFGYSGASTDPSQIQALFYQASPDCNTLVNPIGCPANCPLALVCITLDGMEGAAMSRRYVGLTPGNMYYMRVLWNPIFRPVPDTVRLSLVVSSCFACDPCGGTDILLPTNAQNFNAQWLDNHVALRCDVSQTGNEQVSFMRSLDAIDWQTLGADIQKDDAQWIAQDFEAQQGQHYYYRARYIDADGNETETQIVEIQAGHKAWLQANLWLDDALQLDLDLEADATLRIYDLKGTLRWESQLLASSKQQLIPKSQLGSGLLILNLTGSKQASSTLVNGWLR